MHKFRKKRIKLTYNVLYVSYHLNNVIHKKYNSLLNKKCISSLWTNISWILCLNSVWNVGKLYENGFLVAFCALFDIEKYVQCIL